MFSCVQVRRCELGNRFEFFKIIFFKIQTESQAKILAGPQVYAFFVNFVRALISDHEVVVSVPIS